jgi:hypothetical protein
MVYLCSCATQAITPDTEEAQRWIEAVGFANQACCVLVARRFTRYHHHTTRRTHIAFPMLRSAA